MKLEIELIPEGSWGKSLAQLLPKPVWDVVRREIYQRGNYTCAICESTGVRVHCHEVWEYNDKKRIQFLRGLQCLCGDCHSIKHWGRTVSEVHKGNLSPDYLTKLANHFCRVNNCSLSEFELYKVKIGNTWLQRSRKDYKIDFGMWSPEILVKRFKNGRK